MVTNSIHSILPRNSVNNPCVLEENKKIENIINVYRAFKRDIKYFERFRHFKRIVIPHCIYCKCGQTNYFLKIHVDKINSGLIKVVNQSQHCIKQDERALLLRIGQP